MLKGSVDFVARIADTHITFPRFTFSPPHSGVAALELEGPKGDEIVGTVTLANVATSDIGMNLAQSAIESALNRLAYGHGVAIEVARVTASGFSPMNPPPGHLSPATGHYKLTGYAPRVVRGLSQSDLKALLEASAPAGEVNFGQFRSARLSVGAVEEFMTLYAILLALLGDEQGRVDDFILTVEPGVQRTQSPKRPKVLETTYTRLRNELAHKRLGTSVETTKLSMRTCINGLREIVRQAIARHS